MSRLIEAWNNHEIKIFHICTDGTNHPTVYSCDEDFERANIICAVCAYKNKVAIICFCHMSTHSHFVVAGRSHKNVQKFIEDFKLSYGIYMSHKDLRSNIYRNTTYNIKQISDIYYLKNCISYTLLNPVVAGIVKRPEDYRWSSFKAYFTGNETIDNSTPVREMGTRTCRSVMKTKLDLSKSKIHVDTNGKIVLKSIVNFNFVEETFKSQSEFFKSLALTNSSREEEIYSPCRYKYSDAETLAEILELARRKYGKSSISLLTKEEKHWLIIQARRKIGASEKRLARLLRVSELEVTSVLGTS